MARLPFIRGAHGEILSPDEVDRLRKQAARTSRDAAQFRPIGHWTQGLAQLVDAWGGYAGAQRAREAEQAGRENAEQLIEAAGGRAAIEALLLGTDTAPVADQTSAAVSAMDAPQRPEDWLRYSNQGAVRNQPISEELAAALSFLPEMGVEMEVFSGGQPAEGDARVGSVRHDDGNAADVRFYRDGRQLDWSNPEDVPLFQEIVRQARARGVTGFGAGEGYMQPGTMHIGFGDPAIWGAEGSGENAADWLRQAYAEEVSPVVSALQGGQPQPAQMQAAPQQAPGGQENVVAALMAAAADPWVAQSYGPMIEMALQQQMARQKMGAEQAFKREQADLAHERQFERMDYEQQLRRSDPSYQLGLQKSQLELDALRRPEIRTVNNRLVEIGQDGTSRVIADYNDPADTSKIRDYEYLLNQGVPEEEARVQVFGAVGGSEGSAKAQQIQRLSEVLLERGLATSPEEAQRMAVEAVDGRYVVSVDPKTGEAILVDVFNPDLRAQASEVSPTPPVPADPVAPVTEPVPQPEVVPAENARSAFGLSGAVQSAANWLTDTVGFGQPFPEVAQQQADFATLQQDLLQAVSDAYGRQPPSWLMERIEKLTPEAGSVWTGPDEARNKLVSLERSFNNEIDEVDRSLSKPLRPTARQELEGRRETLVSSQAQIRQALQRLPQGSLTPSDLSVGGVVGNVTNPGAQDQNLPRPQSPEEIQALPSGTVFIAPDGSRRVVP